ncbi:uncharacterized protein LOC112560834 [Pomacea canaliculata]|uniref:uncharacterized protein LOC112560834 n=1 Tax=Pomacea canaliculata TaxID=400727 RepID=UPI000D730994|nr:uncharacterized protein LOC112560834 [Pomacea canaliculata]
MTRSYKHPFGAFLFVIAVIEVAASIPETSPNTGDFLLDPELTSAGENGDPPLLDSVSYEDFPEEDLEAGMGDEADPAGNSRWPEDVDRLMSLLRASAIALERARDNWRSRLRQHEEQRARPKKYRPTNSFVRIGRGGTTSGVSKLLEEATHAQSSQGASPRYLLLTAGDDVGRSKRWNLPRSRFVRIGRRSGEDRGVVPSDGQQAEPHFLKSDRSDDFIPLSRRASFVRIGRLPASAFQLPSLPVDDDDDEVDDGLQSRRSPGYRLTQSGVVRAGR